MNETLTAVAWELHAPSATGGKRHRILVFGEYVVVGWGSFRGTMQYKVHYFMNADAQAVRNFALILTGDKEKKGYELAIAPVQSHLPASTWATDLPELASVRGASYSLDLAFQLLFTQGARISA